MVRAQRPGLVRRNGQRWRPSPQPRAASPQVVGEAGLVFENDDADGLARHLIRLLTDETHLKHYAQLARQRALQLTWQQTWQQIKELVASRQLPNYRKTAKLRRSGRRVPLPSRPAQTQ